MHFIFSHTVRNMCVSLATTFVFVCLSGSLFTWIQAIGEIGGLVSGITLALSVFLAIVNKVMETGTRPTAQSVRKVSNADKRNLAKNSRNFPTFSLTPTNI